MTKETIALNYDSTRSTSGRRDGRFTYRGRAGHTPNAYVVGPTDPDEADKITAFGFDAPEDPRFPSPLFDLDMPEAPPASVLEVLALVQMRVRLGQPVPQSSVPIDEVGIGRMETRQLLRDTLNAPPPLTPEELRERVDEAEPAPAEDTWDDVTAGCQIQVQLSDLTRAGIADYWAHGEWFTSKGHRLGGPGEGSTVRILARPIPIPDWTIIELTERGGAAPQRLVKRPGGWYDLDGALIIPEGERIDGYESIAILSAPVQQEPEDA